MGGSRHSKPEAPEAPEPCPSPSYQWCAHDGGTCEIQDAASGYVSYGTSDTVVLIPFTITADAVGYIQCKNNPGFPGLSFGKPSYCCFISTGTPFTQSGYDYIGNEPELFYSQDTRVLEACSVNYNELGYATCVYAAYTNRYVSFNSDISYFGGDSTRAVWDIVDISWEECGTGGTQCTGLHPNTLYWIRFGFLNTYTYRLVASSTGQIPCASSVFGETQDCEPYWSGPSGDNKPPTCSVVPDSEQFCSRSEPQFIFENTRGVWHHCESMKHSYTVGVEASEARTINQIWTTSITAEFSAGYKFLGHQIRFPDAQKTVNTIFRSFTHTLKETETQTCDDGSFYQWQMSAVQFDGFDISDVKVQGSEFVCIGYGLTPKCPPPFCKDANCQNCTIDIDSDSNSLNAFIDENDHEERKQVNNNQWLFGCIFAVLLLLLLVFGLRKRTKTKTKTRNDVKRRNIINASDAVISYGAV